MGSEKTGGLSMICAGFRCNFTCHLIMRTRNQIIIIQLDQLFSITDLQDFCKGLWTVSTVLFIHWEVSVVELDLELYQRNQRKA